MRANRNFLLAVLTLIGVLNFVDRQIMSILLEDIKEELLFTDLQLGLLSGTLFAIFYSVVGIPVARLSDRWNRSWIISIALFFWSAMTLVSGLATSFMQLALARMGVGIGESGVAPASHSLIAERFGPERRATALAVYAIGGTVGIFLALSVGGWISNVYGWRTAFIVAGLPGVFLGLVAFLLIHEPRKKTSLSNALNHKVEGDRGLFGSLAYLWSIKTWRYAAIATGLTHVATFGIGQWMPTYLRRTYAMDSAETGLVLAFVVGLCGAGGAMLGGVVADKMVARRGIAWLSWTMAIFFGAGTVIAFVALSLNDFWPFIILLAIFFLLVLTSSGVQFAIVQSVVKDDIRATSSALLILVINLFGLGIGPALVGGLSDWFAQDLDFNLNSEFDALRYAMIAVVPINALGAWYYFVAGKWLTTEAHTATDGTAGEDAIDGEAAPAAH